MADDTFILIGCKNRKKPKTELKKHCFHLAIDALF